MSWYYNYTIGYIKDNKIYPFGPYNANGKLKDVFSRSRSFASDLYEDFYKISEEQISDELRKEFEYEDWNEEKKVDVWYLPMSEMPDGDYVKTGYFLIDDIISYLKSKDTEDIFYEHMSSEEYAIRSTQEAKYGKPASQYDCEGSLIDNHSCADYAWFAYPDYISKEYESFLIREVAELLAEYNELPEGAKIVILMTQG